MWNPATSTSIEEVVTEANNLNELLDLMHLCFKKMNPPQTEALLGLALNIASIISVWIEAEERRREYKSD
ncbi:hypothetical protein AB8T65_25610 [Klebsiella pneumoniae]|uniref:Uncharacterized protein n=1 Tax=Klebsiella pneumoniae TaxID=573 RepID=A0A422ZWC0_KLEPN|nr:MULTISPECIES: hypothetical protein [Klebsiella]HCB0130163.1 hypothetical protein [Klebsiella variicola subsp. variicola]EKW2378203.1 hypothetical protein [Klebsiella pneumoniae]EKW2398314.1 hypothetical protein [Klebsiella pneumoniae]EKZ6626893.1 hypothetical protein [Klebsiella pneumoniae]ELH2101174.1 hypothetical protein [Klebsiella pneumoniae]